MQNIIQKHYYLTEDISSVMEDMKNLALETPTEEEKSDTTTVTEVENTEIEGDKDAEAIPGVEKTEVEKIEEDPFTVVEENEKQTEAIAGKIKESLNGKLNGVLGVSIAALLVAAADIVLHVLNILHIF